MSYNYLDIYWMESKDEIVVYMCIIILYTDLLN